MILAKERLLTVDEYLEFEKNSEVRHEYYFGKLIDMPGESKNANRIAKFTFIYSENELSNISDSERIGILSETITINKSNTLYHD
jgi:Uma2 family endonuclease